MPLLELRDISKNFGAIQALRNVSFLVEPGQALGLMGDNGAGKSTLVKIMAGNFPASAGHILMDGEEVRFHKPIEARHHGIEVVYQDLALCDNLTAAANIFLGREGQAPDRTDQGAGLRLDVRPCRGALPGIEVGDAAARPGQVDVRRPATGRGDRAHPADRRERSC